MARAQPPDTDPPAGSILLIAGPVAAGKTTVSKLIVAAWGAPCAYIEGDVFWSFFAQRAPAKTPREGRMRDAKILVQAMISSAARFARGGYDAITDFTVAPSALPKIRAGLKDISLDYVVICPSLAVCAERAATRDEGVIDDYEPLADLHAAFTKLGPLESHAIRDDRAEPEEIAAMIHTGLASNTYRLSTP